MITFAAQQPQPAIQGARVAGFLANYLTQTITVYVQVLDTGSGQVRQDQFIFNTLSPISIGTLIAACPSLTGVRTQLESFLVAQGIYSGTVA